jgi:hypothetical protein
MSSAKAQNKASYSDKEYSQKPLWIAMMDNPKANFFEVEKALISTGVNTKNPKVSTKK